MSVAFEFYKEQGYGMAEDIYRVRFEHELKIQGITDQPKPELRRFHKGRELKR